MAVPNELIGIIHDRSLEGKLDWSDLSNGGFIAQIGELAIIVDRRSNGDIMLRITNEAKTVIDSANSSTRTDHLIEETYESARRKALRIDETLSSLKKALDEL